MVIDPKDEEFIETIISEAERCKILIDMRDRMPKGHGKWERRSPSNILGCCLHQNGSMNFKDPVATAKYHCGPNHISSKGLPGICYDIAIPDSEGPAWLVSDFLDIKMAQGNRQLPGSENLHLISVLVMGLFYTMDPKKRAVQPGRFQPSTHQIRNLEKVINWLMDMFHFGYEGLFGHYHFGKDACPGYFLRGYIEDKREDCIDLITDLDWQQALVNWDPTCLPKYGADGVWGGESKKALVKFQQMNNLPVTAVRDPFTELMLIKVMK